MALPPDPDFYPQRSTGRKPGLSFEPLSEGLGFHPFSDGLPYAPVGKTPNVAKNSAAQPAAGALAAGLPGYAPPPPRIPRIQAPRVPVAAASQPAHHAAPAPRAPQPFSHPQFHHRPAAQIVTAETLAAGISPELLEPSLGFGYMLKRVLAYLVDSAFNLSLCAGALSFALWRQDLSPELLINPGIVLVAGLFLGFFNWAITTAEEVAFGTSIGKRLFGLAIQGGASAIFLRAFFFLPSACFGGIGLLWALFDRRRRCWHDLVVDLQPIEIARL